MVQRNTIGRRQWAVLLAIAGLALVACQQSTQTGQAGGGASIDGFQFGGVHYAKWTMVTSHPKGVRSLGPADLGREVGRVVANRTDELVESARPFRDLEAMFLPDGTPIHAVKGYPGRFRLAARSEGSLAIYEPWPLPSDRVGADLLGGLEGKVVRIGVYSPDAPHRLLGSIDDRGEVERLVGLVLAARAALQDPAATVGDYEPYVVSFHLVDGTATTRAFNAKTGYLPGVVVPEEFTAAIRKAIGRPGAASAP